MILYLYLSIFFFFQFPYLHCRFKVQLKVCISGLKLQVTFAFLGQAEVWIFCLKVLVKTLCNHSVMVAFFVNTISKFDNYRRIFTLHTIKIYLTLDRFFCMQAFNWQVIHGIYSKHLVMFNGAFNRAFPYKEYIFFGCLQYQFLVLQMTMKNQIGLKSI